MVSSSVRVRFLPLIRIGLLRSGPLLLLGVAFPRLFGLRGGTPVSALTRIVLRRFFAHACPPMDAKLPIGQTVPNGGEAPIPSHIRSAIVGLRPARPTVKATAVSQWISNGAGTRKMRSALNRL